MLYFKSRHSQREKQVLKEVKQAESEIQIFQSEKQKRLNEIDIIVTLKLDQLLCIDNFMQNDYVLPKDISDCIVFSNFSNKQQFFIYNCVLCF